MEDRRTIKTKKIIKQTFMNLLKHNPINKISVSEITKLADIGRGTFYIHYLDVYDLQEKIEDEICFDLWDIFSKTYKSSSDFKLLFDAIVNYILEHSEQFSLLAVKEVNSSKLMQKIRQLFANGASSLSPHNTENDYYKIRILFIVSGVIGVIDDWVKNDRLVEKEVVSQALSKIFEMVELKV